MADLGYTFTPGLANRFRAAVNGQATPLGANATQALQILSLHLPDVIGGHAPAPDALLRGGSGLTPDTAVRAMSSGQRAPQAPAPSQSSPLSTPGQNQAPLSVASPAPSFASPGTPPSSSAPSPFPSPLSDSGPTPTEPNASAIPAFRFKGPEQDVPSQPPQNFDLQNLMQSLFGSGFGSSVAQGGSFPDYQNFQR